jgi:flagellar M-ring protein FliF
VRAEATADIDFAQVDTAAEIYKPNSPPEPSSIRSQQTSEAGAPGTPAVGVPGALSNQPPGAATAPIAGATPTTGSAGAGATRKDSTTNYEVDKTIRYEQKPMGGIKRLTVGVLVNHRRIVDAKTGKVTVQALSAAEVAQINDLVKEAMGYSKERGDTLNVTNAPFDGVGRPVDEPAKIPWWKDADLWAMIMEWTKRIIAFLAIAYLFFRILRPMLRPVLRKLDEIADVPPLPPRAQALDEDAQAVIARTELEQMEAGQGQGYRENLQMAKNLAKEDPRVVANVVKAWVGANE